jgi:hypothetical protein
MRHFAGHILGIDQGSVVLFSDFEDGGPMWSGGGPREVRRRIDFDGTFRAPPAVQVALTMWDIDGGPNARVDLTAEVVEAGGFTLVFRTWGDSRIARVRASWLALGEVWGEGDWRL